MSLSYAVLFKTHFWDDFVERQYARLKARAGSGDIYIVVDETFGPAPAIGHGNVVGVTNEDLAQNRLAPITTHGSIIWFNTDYANLVAYAKIPAYDVYIAIEYDVTVNIDLDGLVASVARDGVDFLGSPIRTPVSAWPWYPMMRPYYGEDMLVYLACFAVFSAPAMAVLLARRQALGVEFAAGTLDFWPNNEGFVPTEIRNAGLRIAPLSDYGTAERYDWWPPTDEAELHAHIDQSFIHPVLNGTRYIRSLVHHEPEMMNYFRKNSVLNLKLRRFDSRVVRRILWSAIRLRLQGRLTRALESAGLRRKWYENAKSATARTSQKRPVHNER